MNFLHKSKVDPLTKTHFFCLVHVIPISHLSYPPGPLVVFWETPSRNFLFFWPGLISWLHRFLKSVVSFRARPSRVISMFSSGVMVTPLPFSPAGFHEEYRGTFSKNGHAFLYYFCNWTHIRKNGWGTWPLFLDCCTADSLLKVLDLGPAVC